MKKLIPAVIIGLVVALGATAAGAPAADLTIDYQLNAVAADDAGNYLTFAGKPASVTKDAFDAVSGASKANSTELFTVYRLDPKGGKLLPGGLRGLFLYPVAGDKTRTDDNLSVVKAADGTITIQSVHRGTAYQIVTDKTGALVLPLKNVMTRKIGYIVGAGPQVISSDFSASGTAATVDWKKVWDSKVADGKAINGTANKTGPIATDLADSTIAFWSGKLQVSFDGKILKISGGLTLTKK